MMRTFRKTATKVATTLVLVVDKDDPRIDEYRKLPGISMAPTDHPIWPADAVVLMELEPDESGNLTKATNTAAARVWDEDCVIGHVGDDHAFRTVGWDAEFALDRPGVIYGNDLNVRELVPTAAFMSSVIPRTLGWYALPTTRHLYIDAAWKKIGEELGALTYRDDIVIEHLHPSVGKAAMDDGYRDANGPAMWAHDRTAYELWVTTKMESDIARVRGKIGYGT